MIIGISVTGGFMTGDSLQDVHNFAASYFNVNMAPYVTLSETHSLKPLNLDQTLYSSKMFPRAKLVATALQDASKRLQQSHQETIIKDKSNQQSVSKEVQKKKQEREQIKVERAKILNAFKEDHEKKA